MIDTLHDVETPEGVSLQLRAAGPVVRALAWAIDAGIRLGTVWFGATLLAVLGTAGQGLVFIGMFVVYWLYPIAFEALADGRTIGKRVVGLKVVHASGAPVGWMPAIIRNLLRVVDMFPMLYGFGLASMLLDDRFRRLGDIVAGTLVIHDRPPRLRGGEIHAAPLAPPVLMQPEEQAVLQAFAERSRWLTEDRQTELADLLDGLTHARGPAGVEQLHRHASWIMGRR